MQNNNTFIDKESNSNIINEQIKKCKTNKNIF
jgi:hypothetical protein